MTLPSRSTHLDCTETERRSEIESQLPIHDNLDADLKNQKILHNELNMQQKLAFWNWAALANSMVKLYQESIARLASHSKSTVSLHARKLTGMHSHNKRISGSDYQFAMLILVTYCMSSRYSKKCGNTCFLVIYLRHHFWLQLLTVARSRWQHWSFGCWL